MSVSLIREHRSGDISDSRVTRQRHNMERVRRRGETGIAGNCYFRWGLLGMLNHAIVSRKTWRQVYYRAGFIYVRRLH